MRTAFYLGNKKITKKAAAELVGKERLAEMIRESKEEFKRDPYTQNSYMVSGFQTLVIEFN